MTGPAGRSAAEQPGFTLLSEADKSRIREQLAQIQQSRAFEGSQRCQELIQYLVTRTLAGDFSNLKERLIGAEVFGRDYDYDTSSDAIVRVKATEVRKRLQQYYDQAGRNDILRIHLPIGSYIPRFFVVEPFPAVLEGTAVETSLAPGVDSPAPVSDSSAPRSILRWWPLLLIGVVALATLLLWPRFRPEQPMNLFWEPFLKAGPPVVVCIPASQRIFLPEEAVNRIEASASGGLKQLNLTLEVPDARVVPNGQMSVQNIHATLSIVTYLARNKMPIEFGLASEVSLEQIRQGRVVLIGGFRNPWADALNQQMRYRFETSLNGSHEKSWISDGNSGGKPVWMVPDLWPFGRQTVDYAIISRLFDPSNGQVVIAISGLNGFGTQVAAEFLTDPKFWPRFAQLAPKDWNRKNCQIILETKVIRELPGPPKILTVHCW